jgi:hypothetical protein
MTRLKITFVSLVLLAVGVVILPRILPQPGPSREDCVKRRTSNATMLVKLSGRWGGGPATISHSVTDQTTVGPFDAEAPAWSDYRRVRACDLITLFVTPTSGAGTTTCRIAPVDGPGEAMSSQNRRGGPVRCLKWYASIT